MIGWLYLVRSEGCRRSRARECSVGTSGTKVQPLHGSFLGSGIRAVELGRQAGGVRAEGQHVQKTYHTTEGILRHKLSRVEICCLTAETKVETACCSHVFVQTRQNVLCDWLAFDSCDLRIS